MWSKLRTLHKQKHDIIFLQETKLKDTDANDDLEYRWRITSNGAAYTNPAASSQSGGVAILLSAYACSILQNRHQLPINQNAHRHIIVQASLQNQQVFLHSIYAPVHRAERPLFFSELTTPTSSGSHLAAGDFNCVIDPLLDSTGNHEIATAGSIELTAWLTNLNLCDLWRIHNDDKKEFTSPNGSARIDMIFASGCFTNHTTTSHAPRTIGSDHLCPILTTSSCEIIQQKGHWQLPTWLAAAAARNIKPTLERLASATDHPDYFNNFSSALKDITGRCQATHKRILRWRNDKVDRARLRWIRAHSRAVHSPTDERLNDAEAARQCWLHELQEKGRINRARAFDKHFAEAERCSAFFLRRPKATRATIIPGIRTTEGAISTDHGEIASAHTSFWSKLYSATSNGTEQPPSSDDISTLTQTPLPSLPDNRTSLLEQPITELEIIENIGRLPNNKAAGADGLRAELLKRDPKLWARVLLPIFENLLHEKNDLPQPLRDSIIILLHKKGCPLDPQNYRPIALLSVIAKLLSGIHNCRLRQSLDTIIPAEQTGFIPKRSISENIITLQDAIYYAKRNHPTAIILSLDFQKAYDRVQWHVLKAILKKVGFGPRWLNLISVMYHQRRAKLCINGELTPSFQIQRGVLQGDPLSPALFIIQCLPLYIKLNSTQPQHAIPLPHGPPAPVATFYADDTNLIAKSPNSAVALYSVAEWFCNHSGAKLHPDKCVAIATGPAPPTLPNGIRILNPNEQTTLLGITMGMNTNRHQQTNSVITKMLQRCNGWTNIGRTIEGRVTIARSLLLSTVWYVLGALPIDNNETNRLQRVINNFIHGAQTIELNDPAVKGNLHSAWYYKPSNEGGWGLTPIRHTLRARKLSMIKRFLNEKAKHTPKPWHVFMTHMLEEHLHSWGKHWSDILWWHTDTHQPSSQLGNWNALSPWWREAWSEWLKLKCQPRPQSMSRHQLKRWPIWHNRILKTGHGINGTLHYSFTNTNTRMIMSSIRKLGFISFEDFMQPNGTIMNGDELYTTVTVHASVINDEVIVPRWACDTLSRTVASIWANATRKWLSLSHSTPPADTMWWHDASPNAPFEKLNNKLINRLIMASSPTTPQLRLIKINNTPVNMCWKKERSILLNLAPPHRDLLRRLLRNALPLGSKRIHWGDNAQTLCMLCNSNVVETAGHLFWGCQYATQTWRNIPQPWTNHRRNRITWRDTVCGNDTRLNNNNNQTIDQLWAIIRSCIIRVIWFERNRRYFYANLPTRPPLYRHKQGLDDITAHISSWRRRVSDNKKPQLDDALTILSHHHPFHNIIATTNPNHNGPADHPSPSTPT